MNPVDLEPARETSRAQAYRRPPRRRGVFWLRRAAVLAVIALVAGTVWSLSAALRAPGDDTVTKLAEWGRDHGLGPLVTMAESVQYRLNPPVTGGTPDVAALAPEAHASHGIHAAATAHNALPRLVSPVAPALPGEGVWIPAVTSSAGPLVQETLVRPDAVHTSYLAGVAWMSHRLRFVLHPGYSDPGTAGFTKPDHLTRSELTHLVATFNGGFKLKDAGGGIYDHGTTVGTLTPGAASLVVYADGHATVGTWGVDVSLTKDVAYVRQNLRPLITAGVVAPHLTTDVQGSWGTTVGGGYAVWRSGLGVTASGDLVYVCGDALSVTALADLLHRAGAVTAMQLDINRSWISFMTYSHTSGAVVPHKLVSFARPADRYLTSTSRDFMAVYAP